MKDLAPNHRINKTFLPVLITSIGCIILIIALKNHLFFLGPVILLTIIIGYLFARQSYNNHANAFYDSEFLYLTYQSGTIKIKLQDIQTLRLSKANVKLMGIPYHNYMITYQNEDRSKNSYSFLVNSINHNIESFEKMINYYSPNTRIDRY
ncbi:hypothetical protein FNJ87_06510 [Nonlabens mediterrranea]|uniref:PH domain-containing protein n=1 Tax=Nonlabens mediterrranea TaxID=1419947 RepID=A0ABS0A3S5_9FLAO|nr:hypothetical protein [Nonlabens mediterrranea]